MHLLVCTAFNADFDGDQMAVHVPLGAEAPRPACHAVRQQHRRPAPSGLTVPTQDMIIGLYFTSRLPATAFEGEGRSFIDFDDAMNAYDARAELDLQAKIWVRLTKDTQVPAFGVFEEHKAGERIETPSAASAVQQRCLRTTRTSTTMNKKEISRLVEDVCKPL